MEELKNVWKLYEKIYFYGVGVYGKRTFQYVKFYNKTINGFIVSNNQKIECSYFEEVPIKYLSVYNIKDFDKIVVILTLEKKYHAAVIKFLQNQGVQHICIVSDAVLDFIRCREIVWNELHTIELSKKQIHRYKHKIGKINKKYKKVEICLFDTTRIANVIEIIIEFMDSKLDQSDILFVFLTRFSFGDKVLYIQQNHISNRYLVEKFSKKFIFITENNKFFWKNFIMKYENKISYSDRYSHQNIMKFQHQEVKKNNLLVTRSYMDFSIKEQFAGKCKMKQIGITQEYITFFVRSNIYLQTIFGKKFTNASHDRRNYSLENFRLMCTELSKRNIQSVRMGHIVEGVFEGDGIIDYANKYRDEFMDFYLVSNSKFLVCGMNGFQSIAAILNKPTILINCHLITYNGDIGMRLPEKSIMILKKHWDIKNRRYLRVREILEIERRVKNVYELSDYYIKNQIELIENTPEDIWEATKEMLDRLEGRFESSEAEGILQLKFKNLVRESISLNDNFFSEIPIGRAFLKKNLWMLE